MAHHQQTRANKKPKEPSSQSTTVALGIGFVILAVGFFVAAFFYWHEHATTCHFFPSSKHIITTVVMRWVCSIFENNVSDQYKPIFGGIFFCIIGIICILVARNYFKKVQMR